MNMGMASTGINSGTTARDSVKKRIQRWGSPSFGMNLPLSPGSNCEMKNGDALELRQPSAVST